MADGPIGVDEVDENWAPKMVDAAVPFEIDDQAAILDERNGLVVPLAPTASLAMEYFDGSVSLGDLASDVAEVFDIGRAAAVTDLVDFARELGRLEMLDGVTTRAVPHMPGDQEDCAEPGGADATDVVSPDCIPVPPDH